MSQVTRGQGELNIAEGKYAALGRLLDIERGRLIFNNGPLGDPGHRPARAEGISRTSPPA